MEPLRVLHFADLHLGVEAGGRTSAASGLNQRIHDVLDRLDEVCACVEDEDVHAVVFAGDAFKHQHPTPTLQTLFAERVRRLARRAAVFLLVGNHDLPKMASLSHPFSIYPALEVDRVVVGDRAEVYRLPVDHPAGEVQVAALPHFSRHELLARTDASDDDIQDAVAARVAKLAGATDPALPAVFAGHCHVNQSQLSTAQNLFGVSDLEVTLSTLVSGGAFAYYALGHVHRHQVLNRDPYCAYPGSLERVDFGEGETVRIDAAGRVRRTPAEDKGYYRFDLEPGDGGWRLASEPSFRTVSARRFLTVRCSSPDGTEPNEAVMRALDASGAETAGALVRIVVELDASDRPRLSHQRIREALPDAYDVRVMAEAPAEASHVRDPRFATRMGELEALEAYLATKQEWADDRTELLRLGRALIDEVLA